MPPPNLVKSADMSNYDLLTVVMIYTADDFMDLQNDIIKMLSVLLSRNLAAKERMNILEDSFDIAMTEKVKQEVAGCLFLDAACAKIIKLRLKRVMKHGEKEKVDITASQGDHRDSAVSGGLVLPSALRPAAALA